MTTTSRRTPTEWRVVWLSYACPFRCGWAHDVGFVDPAKARTHIATVHNSRRKPVEKRWPHSALTYDSYGVQGPM